MYNLRFTILRLTRIITFLFLLFIIGKSVAQTKSKTPVKKSVKYTISKVAYSKLPQSVFLQLIDSTASFEVNHSTEFKHIDLPKRFYNTFLSYIKDSSSTEVLNLKSIVYYGLTLSNGKIINGDIYWNDSKSYIVFKIDDKRYVNYFTKDGVAQIKTLFKL